MAPKSYSWITLFGVLQRQEQNFSIWQESCTFQVLLSKSHNSQGSSRSEREIMRFWTRIKTFKRYDSHKDTAFERWNV